jgi:hypothetical protein
MEMIQQAVRTNYVEHPVGYRVQGKHAESETGHAYVPVPALVLPDKV